MGSAGRARLFAGPAINQVQLGKIDVNISNDTFKHPAVSNALSSVDRDRRFPKKVLIGHWEDYLFFEDFFMWVPGFIDVTKSLLAEDKASAVALINLGNVIPIDYDNPPTIFIEKDTDAKEYISQLNTKIAGTDSEGHPFSWRMLVDRYVCASNTGNWAIYSEKQNDVAVFAFRAGFSQPILSQVKHLLKARSVTLASAAGDNQSFDFGKLLLGWKSTLVAEHSLTNDQ
jgi:hypothetical protein